MGTISLIVISFVCIGLGSCVTWKKCGGSNPPIKVTNFDLTPDPVPLPGKAKLSVTAQSTETLRSLDLKLTIKRVVKAFGRWTVKIPVPCLFKIGSCTYKNTCTLLDRMVRENWGGISRTMARQMKAILSDSGISTTCPIAPTTFRVQDKELSFPRMPRFLSMFASGKYDVQIKATDQSTGREMMCLEFNMNVRT